MLAACSKVGAGKAGRRIKMTTDHQHYVFSSYILKRMRGRSSNILQLQHFTDYSTVKRGSSREVQRQQTAPTAEGTEELGCASQDPSKGLSASQRRPVCLQPAQRQARLAQNPQAELASSPSQIVNTDVEGQASNVPQANE